MSRAIPGGDLLDFRTFPQPEESNVRLPIPAETGGCDEDQPRADHGIPRLDDDPAAGGHGFRRGGGAKQAPQPATATFAGGCFWCMESPFDKQDGVLSVTVGYTGGQKKNPTYEEGSAGGAGHAAD